MRETMSHVSKMVKLKVSALVLTLILSDICRGSVPSETNEMNEEKKRQQVIKGLHRFDKIEMCTLTLES